MVMVAIFKFSGTERFLPMLIGLVALRWSVGCAIQASRVAQFRNVSGPFYRRSFLATMLLAMGPSTVVFVISILLVSGFVVVVHGSPPEVLHMAKWGGFSILVQLTWNALLVFLIIYARTQRQLVSEVPILFAFVLLLILSPVAYQFSDIPPAASSLLTSLNPASHLIAAYQNSLWYIVPVSLEILPMSAVVAVSILVVLSGVLRGAPADEAPQNDPDTRHLTWDGRTWYRSDGAGVPDDAVFFRPWRGELPWVNGRNILLLLNPYRRRLRDGVGLFDAFSTSAEPETLLESPIQIYAEMARDRLCIVAALSHRGRPIVLDGLLDSGDVQNVRRFCNAVTDLRRDAGSITIISRRDEISRALIGFIRQSPAAEPGSNVTTITRIA